MPRRPTVRALRVAEQLLAPAHFVPNLRGPNTGRGPHHDQIVEKVGAFADHGRAISVHRVDNDLDGFFYQLLGDLGAPSTQQPGRAGNDRIGTFGGKHCVVKSFDRITHSANIVRTR